MSGFDDDSDDDIRLYSDGYRKGVEDMRDAVIKRVAYYRDAVVITGVEVEADKLLKGRR